MFFVCFFFVLKRKIKEKFEQWENIVCVSLLFFVPLFDVENDYDNQRFTIGQKKHFLPAWDRKREKERERERISCYHNLWIVLKALLQKKRRNLKIDEQKGEKVII